MGRGLGVSVSLEGGGGAYATAADPCASASRLGGAGDGVRSGDAGGELGRV